MESLVLAGAFDRLGERRQLLWDLTEAFDLVHRPQPPLPLLHSPDERAKLSPLSPERKLALTFGATGVTGGFHLTLAKHDAFTKAGCIPYRELWGKTGGAKVKVGGLVADGVRRPPTAKGTSFLQLDGPDGIIDIVIPIKVYETRREEVHSLFLVVEGTLQKRGPTITVVAQKAFSLQS